MRLSFSAVSSSLSVLVLTTILAGCSSNFETSSATAPAGTQIGLIKGKIYGGQQPVAGATVFLYAASTTGYGAASTSLLKTGVTTNSGGGFSLTGDYVCVPGTQVYLYTNGGDAGGGPNPALGFMAVLGQCPATGTLAGEVPFLIVNEVTTVAAAYAFAGFAVDATHVGSSGTLLAQTGIANAFATAGNLANIAQADQGALAVTPAGNGTAPQAKLNALADILASCVNSTDTPHAACSTVLSAMSGGTTGTAPTDTASAAINIAHNPSANVAALYALVTPTAPFKPATSSVPNDWTLQIGYSGGGYLASSAIFPHQLAVDGVGNIWFANYAGNVVSEFSPLGIPVSADGYTSAGLDGPVSVAIDETGNVWTADWGETAAAGTTISEFTAGGVSVADYSAGLGLTGPDDIEFDGSGNGFISDEVNDNIVKISTVGTLLGTSTTSAEGLDDSYSIALEPGAAGSVWAPNLHGGTVSLFSNDLTGTLDKAIGGPNLENAGVAVDAAGNAWVTNVGAGKDKPATGQLVKITTAGTVTKYKPGAAQSALDYDLGVTIDGGGNVFVTDFHNGVIYEVNSAGTTLSGSYGFAPPGNSGYGGASIETITVDPTAIASDGSGNVWYSTTPQSNTSADNMLYEIVGAAVPVVTPISVAVANSTLATEP